MLHLGMLSIFPWYIFMCILYPPRDLNILLHIWHSLWTNIPCWVSKWSSNWNSSSKHWWQYLHIFWGKRWMPDNFWYISDVETMEDKRRTSLATVPKIFKSLLKWLSKLAFKRPRTKISQVIKLKYQKDILQLYYRNQKHIINQVKYKTKQIQTD